MKRIEKISEKYVVQVNFHDKRKSLIDINHLFEKSLSSYKKTFEEFGLTISYDFRNRTNKRFFFNELVKNYIEMMKVNEYPIYFCRYEVLPNKFQEIFIKKLKSVFGISILDIDMDLSTLIYFYEKGYVEQVQLVDTFFESKREKKFQKIKKFLEKEGLFYLYNVCVDNINGKMCILSC